MSTSNFQWRHDGLRWRIKLMQWCVDNTLGSCTIRIDADIFAVQQDGIVTQKVVAKTDVFQFDSPL